MTFEQIVPILFLSILMQANVSMVLLKNKDEKFYRVLTEIFYFAINIYAVYMIWR